MTDWLLDLPKVELHCHLEGSMSSATVKALAARHQPDWSWVWSGDIPDHFSFVDFPDFGRQYLFGLSLLRNEEDLATITDDLAATLAQQNVRYAELTTTAFSHLAGYDPAEVNPVIDESGTILLAFRSVHSSSMAGVTGSAPTTTTSPDLGRTLEKTTR